MPLAEQLAKAAMLALVGLAFAGNHRKLSADDEQGPNHGDDTDDQIRTNYAQGFEAKIGVVGMRRLARRNFLSIQVNAGKDKYRADQRPGNRAQRIERLREIQTALRTVGIAELGNKRVGSRLQEGEPAGDDKEREQKESVTSGLRRRPKQECACGKKQQAHDETRFVACSLHHEARGNRQKEITQVEGGLHQTSLKAGNLEGLHEVPDEDVVQVIGDSPEEEKCGDENKGNDLSRWKQ